MKNWKTIKLTLFATAPGRLKVNCSCCFSPLPPTTFSFDISIRKIEILPERNRVGRLIFETTLFFVITQWQKAQKKKTTYFPNRFVKHKNLHPLMWGFQAHDYIINCVYDGIVMLISVCDFQYFGRRFVTVNPNVEIRKTRKSNLAQSRNVNRKYIIKKRRKKSVRASEKLRLICFLRESQNLGPHDNIIASNT